MTESERQELISMYTIKLTAVGGKERSVRAIVESLISEVEYYVFYVERRPG